MNTQWLEAARIFVLYVLPVTVAAGTLALFFRVLGRMKHIETRLSSTEKDLRRETAMLSNRLTSLEKEAETTPNDRAKALTPSAGANATTRAKALKMHRLGQSAEQIASTLRLPRGDVILLLKVHGIVLRTFEPQQKTLNGMAD
jgi:hypothetical protein